MRSTDAVAAARSFVAAGRQPADPANVDRRPFVKICGVTEAEGALAAVRAGADAIGLNLVAGTPPGIGPGRGGRARPGDSRRRRPGTRPRIVAITADASADLHRGHRRRARSRRDPVQRPRVLDAPGRRPTTGLEGPARRGHRPCRCVRPRHLDRAWVPRRWCRTPPPRHRRWAPPRWHRRARRRGRSRGDRPRGARHPGRRPVPGQRRRGAAGDRGGRCRRGVRRGGTAGSRSAATQGPAEGGLVREAGEGGTRRPAQRGRSARRPSIRACWIPMPPGAGAWNGTSAAATSPRR